MDQGSKIYDKFLNSIRLRPYRVACKLRFLQKDSKFDLIDLVNTIEIFREFGMNTNSNCLEISVSRSEIQSLIYSLFKQLSQRVPVSIRIDIDKSVLLVYKWIIETFQNSDNFLNLFALKIALTFFCSSSYSDKLKYLFTLLSDTNGFLLIDNFIVYVEFLKEIYTRMSNEQIELKSISIQKLFGAASKIDVRKFVQSMTDFEDQNEIFQWLIIYHRMFDSESVVHHHITCDSCGKTSFEGFRYKCKICSNYNQCQNCFWTGRSSKNHDPDAHTCKEYLNAVGKNNFRRSFRKSFRNSFRWFPPKNSTTSLEKKNKSHQNVFNEQLILKKLNLSNIVSPQLYRKNQNINEIECKLKDNDVKDLNYDILLSSSEHEHKLIKYYLDILKENINDHHQKRLEFTNEEYLEKKIDELEKKNAKLMKSIHKKILIGDENSKNDAETLTQFPESAMLTYKQ
ncbi:Protein unc-13-like protein [Sarcoptes scabiei]|nr:Protein unc-13-like protein [Sarcoptes scabiei]